MQAALAEKLVCPMDRQDLELKIFLKDTENNIVEGMLHCAHCKRYYPIIHGVPVLSPDEYREFSMEEPLLQRWQEEQKLLGSL